jgi:hypothetical protein
LNGNLISDLQEGLTIEWFNNGKVKRIMNDSLNVEIFFFYDPMGKRIEKRVINQITSDTVRTLYSLDAQGNSLANYKYINNDSLWLEDFNIYGSTRIGQYSPDSILLYCDSCIVTDTIIPVLSMGNKQYELTNHLGNVMTTISDKKIFELITLTPLVYTWKPEVLSWQDYYPFGMIMPGRKYNSEEYRFSFNGFENDDEVKGIGNHNSFGDYGYDTRVVARWRPDPECLQFPGYSPYAAFANNPIFYRDIGGRIIDPSPLDPSQRVNFKTVVKTLSSSSLFTSVYSQVHNSPEYFTVSSQNATPRNLYELARTGGHFSQAKDLSFLGYVYSNAGDQDNPHKITLNKYTSPKTGKSGFTPGTILEETFHAGQYLHQQRTGISQSPLSREVEAKVANSFLGHQNSEGLASVENYGVESYTNKFLGNIDVQNYFKALTTGTEITKEMESGFRGAVKTLSKDVYSSYSKLEGWSSSEKPETFSGATPYFDELTK